MFAGFFVSLSPDFVYLKDLAMTDMGDLHL